MLTDLSCTKLVQPFSATFEKQAFAGEKPQRDALLMLMQTALLKSIDNCLISTNESTRVKNANMSPSLEQKQSAASIILMLNTVPMA